MKEDLLQYDKSDVALILLELDRAISSNQKWQHDLNRGLISKEAITEEFLQENAHEKTQFGQWLYNGTHPLLATNQGVQAIEASYRLLHEEAYKLAHARHANREIEMEGYDAFIKHLSEYQQFVTTFRDNLIEIKGIFDPLTGLLGRQSLMLQLTKEQSLVGRGIHECAIVMMDIDHFKMVNDTFGHQGGDTALCYVAQLIRFNLRPYDSSFRYGGEEFLVCLPNTSSANAFLVMDRLREEIAEMPIDLPDGKEVSITISMGIAMMEPETTIEATIGKADFMLYSAKNNGRNRVEMAEPSISKKPAEGSA